MKVHLRYRLDKTLGLISSSSSNILFNNDNSCAYAPTLESISTWNLKTAVVSQTFTDSNVLVTVIARFQNSIAAGYADGSIRVWLNDQMTVFNGHRAPVTCLAFDANGARLASGSSDTDIILWDIVAETGIARFKGHKDQVTCLAFLQDPIPNSTSKLNHLVSGSKDTLVKIWDIDAHVCVENIVLHRGQVWALDVFENTLVTGAADGLLRFWSIDPTLLAAKLVSSVVADKKVTDAEIEKSVTLLGTVERQSKERTITLKFHSSGSFIGVQGADKLIEIFKVRNEKEIKKAMSRRKKRLEKKTPGQSEITETLMDKYPSFATIRCSSKIRSFDFGTGFNNHHIKVLVGLSNNAVELYEVDSVEVKEKIPARLVSTIDLPGHRSDIRTLALSDDDEYLVSGSSDMIKVWALQTGNCVQTLSSGYALCSAFLPGNKHIVVGTKAGELQLYELSSSTLLETIEAHSGPIWSLKVLPDKTGLVTGSQDKQVKFWKFSMIDDPEYSRINKRASLTHTRTLKLSDDILCVTLSPDGKLLAVSLLDLTVKIFYIDTLKFFLSLYGHKLPVISMDISSDSRIIITSSSDKTVKIWGLDFGDCHKSLLCHQDSVMQCQFIWGTYHFFTVSKDKSIKMWDAEKFDEICQLDGHQGEIWSLAVGKYGNFIVTGSHDKSIRIWEKTDEQFVLSEERDAKMEKLYEQMELDDNRYNLQIGSGVETDEKNDAEDDQTEQATKQTTVSLKSGELLAEALTVWQQDQQDHEKYLKMRELNPDTAKPTRNPFILIQGGTELEPSNVVLKIIYQIQPSHLQDALLTLPFSLVITLLECLAHWVEKDLDPTMTSKILIFLLKTHHHEITTTKTLKVTLTKIRERNASSLKLARNQVGFNLSALEFLNREWVANRVTSFDDPKADADVGGAKRKRTVVVS
ncbi:WD40-repeat-containing domain protein [Globomyces pollinis-pini]|nr:WD40-repeat-containing domain protein [Globomyces pollinis-pini]